MNIFNLAEQERAKSVEEFHKISQDALDAEYLRAKAKGEKEEALRSAWEAEHGNDTEETDEEDE